MEMERFIATVLPGHKQDAVRVPFDPVLKWNAKAEQLWPGRRGFRVAAEIKGHHFESAIVARSRTFWLLLPDDAKDRAGVATGDEVDVSLRPIAET